MTVRNRLILAAAVVLAAVSVLAVPATARTGGEHHPRCQWVVFTQASGSYTRRFCDTGLTAPPAGQRRQLAVSGGNITDPGTVVFGYLIPAPRKVSHHGAG
jgi:hypothetical protein